MVLMGRRSFPRPHPHGLVPAASAPRLYPRDSAKPILLHRVGAGRIPHDSFAEVPISERGHVVSVL